ncbi:MAG: hypothetical protein ACKO0N_04795, partial [Planctomycetota bacterium]
SVGWIALAQAIIKPIPLDRDAHPPQQLTSTDERKRLAGSVGWIALAQAIIKPIPLDRDAHPPQQRITALTLRLTLNV